MRETEEIKKKEKARGIDEQAEIKIFNNHKRHLARLQKERARAKVTLWIVISFSFMI